MLKVQAQEFHKISKLWTIKKTTRLHVMQQRLSFFFINRIDLGLSITAHRLGILCVLKGCTLE